VPTDYSFFVGLHSQALSRLISTRSPLTDDETEPVAIT
jgi:hypothetical protein